PLVAPRAAPEDLVTKVEEDRPFLAALDQAIPLRALLLVGHFDVLPGVFVFFGCPSCRPASRSTPAIRSRCSASPLRSPSWAEVAATVIAARPLAIATCTEERYFLGIDARDAGSANISLIRSMRAPSPCSARSNG